MCTWLPVACTGNPCYLKMHACIDPLGSKTVRSFLFCTSDFCFNALVRATCSFLKYTFAVLAAFCFASEASEATWLWFGFHYDVSQYLASSYAAFLHWCIFAVCLMFHLDCCYFTYFHNCLCFGIFRYVSFNFIFWFFWYLLWTVLFTVWIQIPIWIIHVFTDSQQT